jgi:hypothetical protein
MALLVDQFISVQPVLCVRIALVIYVLWKVKSYFSVQFIKNIFQLSVSKA